MIRTSCTDEVRVMVSSFHTVTFFLRYKIFHRDVINLFCFVLFEAVTDYHYVRRIKLKSFVSIVLFVFFLHNDMRKNTISSLIIEIQLKACNVHTTIHTALYSLLSAT